MSGPGGRNTDGLHRMRLGAACRSHKMANYGHIHTTNTKWVFFFVFCFFVNLNEESE